MASSPVDLAMARAAANRKRDGAVSPIDRIRALPSRPYEDHAAAAAMADKWTARLRRVPNAPPLRPIQGWFLEELARFNGTPRGGLAPIGVGHGKTLASLLAGTVGKSERTLLLIPASLRKQYEGDLTYWLRYYRFIPPTVLTYGQLSRPTSSALLARLEPTMIVADECHYLRHATSARTKRVRRYFREHPLTRFVGLSGTITSTSLNDYAHLLDWALRDLCPLPMSYHDREQWAACLDVGSEAALNDWRAVWPLVGQGDPARYRPVRRREIFRAVFKERLRSTPGVVSTSDASVGASLLLRHVRPMVPPEITDALKRLHDLWEMPDGEPITEAVDYFRNARHLSLGFYYKRVWPNGKDVEWLEARRDWWSAVRWTLRYSSRAGYDSPALLAEAAIAGKGSRRLLDAWEAWEPVRKRAPPPSHPVWLTEAILEAVVRWRMDHPDTLVWYQSRAVGLKLWEMGFDTFGQGSDTPSGPLPAASIRVHGKGQNLQKFADQLVIEPPSSGSIWEQLLGRTHRQGQKSDTVRCAILTHTVPMRAAVEVAIQRAQYIEKTTGQRQKLVFCRWEG